MLETLTNVISTLSNKFAVALIILFIGLILGKLCGKLLQKLLREVDLDHTLQDALHIRFPLTEIVSSSLTYLIYFIALVIALDTLGVVTHVLSIVSIGLIIIVILFIFLGVKDFIPNAVAGLFVHRKKFISPGDIISVDEIQGEVVYINLIETRIKTANGDLIYIPNAHLTKHKVRKMKNAQMKNAQSLARGNSRKQKKKGSDKKSKK
jgi:small-conductance mechanosensitive channel